MQCGAFNIGTDALCRRVSLWNFTCVSVSPTLEPISPNVLITRVLNVHEQVSICSVTLMNAIIWQCFFCNRSIVGPLTHAITLVTGGKQQHSVVCYFFPTKHNHLAEILPQQRSQNNRASYSISQEICTRFCCVLLCCGYVIVHNEFKWSIYPYSPGLLCWHWDNRQIATVPVK